MVLLVPRQLRRSGMTGAVPYYGGRLTPAHIQALSHPSRPAPPPPPPPPPLPPTTDALAALHHLHATGVISDLELEELRARVGS